MKSSLRTTLTTRECVPIGLPKGSEMSRRTPRSRAGMQFFAGLIRVRDKWSRAPGWNFTCTVNRLFAQVHRIPKNAALRSLVHDCRKLIRAVKIRRMSCSMLAARAVIAAAVVAVIALAALHVLKPNVHPSRNMISLYALGRHGWLMALCFAAFAAASASLVAALLAHVPSLLGGFGLAFLVLACVAFAMPALFPMDPFSTPAAQMSFSGKMHGVAFFIGIPCQVLSVLLLSLTLGSQAAYMSSGLLGFTAVIWLSLGMMIAIMLMVGPGKAPNPSGPERFVGLPNRLFMVAYGV